MLVSVSMMSWSLMPGMTVHLLTSDGLLVASMSRMLFWRVGSVTSWLHLRSWSRLIRLLLIATGYMLPVIDKDVQSMSGRLVSSPMYTCCLGCFETTCVAQLRAVLPWCLCCYLVDGTLHRLLLVHEGLCMGWMLLQTLHWYQSPVQMHLSQLWWWWQHLHAG